MGLEEFHSSKICLFAKFCSCGASIDLPEGINAAAWISSRLDASLQRAEKRGDSFPAINIPLDIIPVYRGKKIFCSVRVAS